MTRRVFVYFGHWSEICPSEPKRRDMRVHMDPIVVERHSHTCCEVGQHLCSCHNCKRSVFWWRPLPHATVANKTLVTSRERRCFHRGKKVGSELAQQMLPVHAISDARVERRLEKEGRADAVEVWVSHHAMRSGLVPGHENDRDKTMVTPTHATSSRTHSKKKLHEQKFTSAMPCSDNVHICYAWQ